MFLSKQSVLFVKEMAWVYGTVSTVNDNHLASKMADICDKDLQFYYGPLWMSTFLNVVPT